MKSISKYWYISSAVFVVIYALISLVNHYFFRTSTLDLGLYTHNMYDYIRFSFSDTAIFKETVENQLADHFDLYLILFSPLSLIFKTYTLLIVQILAIAFGSLGMYKLVYAYSSSKKMANWAAVFLYSFFGIFSAISFDYHSNVVAAMLLPWFMLYIKERKHGIALIFLLLILIAKENMALWMFFVCTGLMYEYRKERKQVLRLGMYTLFSLVYFVLIVWLVMPALSVSADYAHFDFHTFGETPKDIVIGAIQAPGDFFQKLFSNHIDHPFGKYVKLELIIYLLLSGGFFALYRFHYAWMIIPIILQKLMHDNINMWGVGFHYNVEFGVVLSIAVFTSLCMIKRKNIRNILMYLSLVLCIAVSFRSMDYTKGYNDKKRVRFYQASHYTQSYDVSKVYQALKLIPKDAVVSAMPAFTPHLALRDKLYTFPTVKDAEYLVLSTHESIYQIDDNIKNELICIYIGDNKWEALYTSDGLYILKFK